MHAQHRPEWRMDRKRAYPLRSSPVDKPPSLVVPESSRDSNSIPLTLMCARKAYSLALSFRSRGFKSFRVCRCRFVENLPSAVCFSESGLKERRKERRQHREQDTSSLSPLSPLSCDHKQTKTHQAEEGKENLPSFELCLPLMKHTPHPPDDSEEKKEERKDKQRGRRSESIRSIHPPL